MMLLVSPLIIGLVAGWLWNSLAGGRGGLGTTGSLITGVVGAYIAVILLILTGASLLGLQQGEMFFYSFIAAMVGAIVSLLIVGLIKR